MSLLSVTERELRVAARRRRTYEIRMSTAIIGLAVCASTLELVTVTGASAIPGDLLFRVLSWISFVTVAITGSILASDSISRERREGTLELLFLANLRAHSIALGKLFSHGLVALYSILGMLPVMAIPILLGGSDLISLFRIALVLLLLLFISLTVGLICSSLSIRAWTASSAAICIVGGLVIALPFAASVSAKLGHPEWAPWIEPLSPSYLLMMAQWTAQNLTVNYFWTAFAVQTALCFLTLLVLFKLLSRLWQNAPAGVPLHPLWRAWYQLRYGSGPRRVAIRKLLLERNPLLWLSAREPLGSWGLVLFICLVGLTITYVGSRQSAALGPRAPDVFIVPLLAWIWALPILYIIVCFRIAVVASERFASDRKTGALELILSTPLRIEEIVRGQWLAIARQLWGAGLFLLLIHAGLLYWIVRAFTLDFHAPGSFRNLITRPILHLAGRAVIPAEQSPLFVLPLAISAAAVLIVVLWIALGWLGMFLGLKVQRQIAAPWSALILLAIPPLPFFVAFAAFLFTRNYLANDIFERMLTLGFAGFVFVLANALFWLWLSRRWIYRNLRRSASERIPERRWFRLA